ncbi:hypothetical protein [Prescottella subtropica]|uniref:hypothetical protein n=1 Tax=Prescottella subtropica TaxID=2545757 RepID=UPI0010F47C69|nr:hypothetical protein [Prescottella subtropica]
MSTTTRKRKTPTQADAQHPRVRVSRIDDRRAPKVSRDVESVRRRLAAGAKLIVVDTGDDVIELNDADLRASGQHWTLRIAGNSTARIHCSAPLPDRVQIVATDSAFVEVTGRVTIHAYTNATVHAFDECVVHAWNFAVVSVCDTSTVVAGDDTVVTAYDSAGVRASGRARVSAGDATAVHLDEDASAAVQRGVRVTGPSRSNLTVRSR